MVSLNENLYRESVSDYEKNWTVMDRTLYRLCQDNPDHTIRSSVCAKLWIVGRTYATGIERKIAADGSQGSSMSQVAELFLQNASAIDSWLRDLRSISGELDAEKLGNIVWIHGKLVKLLGSKTQKSQSTRSFVSKYLHFHNSVVPIYDSIAVAALRSVVRWRDDLNVFPMPVDADEEYGWFVMRFFDLYGTVKAAGLSPTVRHVDYYLLTLALSSYTSQAPASEIKAEPTPIME